MGLLSARAKSQAASPLALIDAFFNSWASWRDACEAVEGAYRQWTRAAAFERDAAFERYWAALDREERAARFHAACTRRIGGGRPPS